MNPVDKLYDYLASKQLLDGQMKDKAAFAKAMQDEGQVRSLYGFLSAKNAVDNSEDEFVSKLIPQKKNGGGNSTVSSSTQTSAPSVEAPANDGTYLPPTPVQPQSEPTQPSFGPQPSGITPQPKLETPFQEDTPQVDPTFGPKPSGISEQQTTTDSLFETSLGSKMPDATEPKPKQFGPTKEGIKEADLTSEINRFDPLYKDTAPVLTGEEDIFSYQSQDKETDAKRLFDASGDNVRMGKLRMEKINKYGQDASLAVNSAAMNLDSRFGKGWMDKYTEAKSKSGESTPVQQEYKKFVDQIEGDEYFTALTGAVKASERARAEYASTMKSNPEYASWMKLLENRQAEVDQKYADGGFLNGMELFKDRLLKETFRVLGSTITSIPNAAEAVTGTPAQFKGMKDVGGFLSDISEVYPKPAALSRSMFEKQTNWNGLEVVVGDDGKPSAAYREGNPVTLTEQQKQEFASSAAAKNARYGVSGGMVLGDKALDMATFLLEMRYGGGGSKGGTAIAAYMTQQEENKRQAEQQGLSSADAALYSLIQTGVGSVLEGYVGDFESTIFKKRAMTKVAEEVAKKDAKVLASGITGWDRLKSFGSNLIDENIGELKEEFSQMIAEKSINSVYNKITGTQFDDKYSASEIAETAVLTTLLTSSMGSVSQIGVQHDPLTVAATMRAVEDQSDKFGNLLGKLVGDGKITQERADEVITSISNLKAFNERLPDDMDRQSRAYVLSAQAYRDGAQKRIDTEPMTEVEKQQLRESIKDADSQIQGTIDGHAQFMYSEAPGQVNFEDKYGGRTYEEVLESYNRRQDFDIPSEEVAQDLIVHAANSGVKKSVVYDYDGEVDSSRINAKPPKAMKIDAIHNRMEKERSRALMIGSDSSAQITTDGMLAMREKVATKETKEKEPLAWFETAKTFFDDPRFGDAVEGLSIAELALHAEKGKAIGQVSSATGFILPITFGEKTVNIGSNVLANAMALARAKGATSVKAEIMDQEVAGSTYQRVKFTTDNGIEFVAQGAVILEGNSGPRVKSVPIETFKGQGQGQQTDLIGNEIKIVQNEARTASKQRNSQAAQVVEGDSGTANTQQTKIENPISANEGATQQAQGVTTDAVVQEAIQTDTNQVAEVGNMVPDFAAATDIQAKVNAEVDTMTDEEVVAFVDAIGENQVADVSNMISDFAAATDITHKEVMSQVDELEGEGAIEEAIAAVEEAIAKVELPTNVTPDVLDVLLEVGTISPGEYFFAMKGLSDGTSKSLLAYIKDRIGDMRNPEAITTQPLPSRGTTSRAATFIRTSLAKRLEAATSLTARVDMVSENWDKDDKRIQQRIQQRLATLKVAFAGMGVNIETDREAFAAAKAEAGVTGSPAGMVYKGVVYLDSERIDGESLVHELRHVWSNFLKVNNPALFTQHIEMMRGTEYEAMVRNNPNYKHLTSDEDILEEALALGIGERGAALTEATKWQSFQTALKELWKSLKEMLGLHDPSTATVNDFIDSQAYAIYTGNVTKGLSKADIDKYKSAIAQSSVPSFFFVGEQYIQADVLPVLRTAYATANAMIEAGKSTEEVYNITGIIVGPDGMIRVWQDPHYFRLWIDENSNELSVKEGKEYVTNLVSILALNGVYEAYPTFKDTVVRFVNKPNATFKAQVVDGAIEVNVAKFVALSGAEFQQALKSSLYHEIQHMVQHEEGFFKGTSPAELSVALDYHLADVKVRGTKQIEAAALAYIKQIATLNPAYSAQLHELAYRNSYGEVEARMAAGIATGNVTPEAAFQTMQALQLHPLFNAVLSQGVGFAQNNNTITFAKTLFKKYGREVLQQSDQHIADVLMTNDVQLLNSNLTASQKYRLRQLMVAEIKANGLKNEKATITAVAKQLNISENDVRDAWSFAAKVTYGIGGIQINTNGESNKALLKRISTWLKDQFATKGLMNDDTYDANLRKVRRHNTLINKTAYLAKDLERAIITAFGKNVGESQRQLVNAVINGKALPSSLPASIRPIVIEIRRNIDELSREYVYQGGLSERAIEVMLTNSGAEIHALSESDKDALVDALKIAPNQRSQHQADLVDSYMAVMADAAGTYLHRSYRVHSEKGYKDKVPAQIRRRAEEFLAGQYMAENAALTQDLLADEAVINQVIAEKTQAIADAKNMLQARIAAAQAELSNAQATGARKSTIKRLNGLIGSLNILESQQQAMELLSDDDIKHEIEANSTMQGVSKAVSVIIRARNTIILANEQLVRKQGDASKKIAENLEAIDNVAAEVEAILANSSQEASFAAGGTLGSVKQAWLKERKDIPEPIRELLGEYLDPTINMTKTMIGLSNMVQNKKFLNEVAELGIDKFFFKKPKGDYVVKISAEGSPSMQPLDGLYTTQELYDAFKSHAESQKNEHVWMTAFMMISGRVKYGKTILSPETQARNFFGNVFFLGYNDWGRFLFHDGVASSAYQSWAQERKSLTDPQKRAYYENLIRLGVLDDGANFGDIKFWLDRMDVAALSDATERAAGKGKTKLASSLTFLENMYSFGDNFYRIIGFEAEKRKYSQALYRQDYNQLSQDQKDIVDKTAADLVSNLVPTYSKIPKALQALKKLPFLGTFVSFPYEMYRITAASIGNVSSEINNPATRAIGIKRALAMSATMFAIDLTKKLLMDALGMLPEEDEAYRQFAPNWIKNSTIFYTKKLNDEEKGKGYQFVNISYSDPTSVWKKSILAAIMDNPDGMSGRLKAATWEAVDAFASPELSFSTLAALYTNTDDKGNPIADSDMGVASWYNIKKRFDFARKKMQPGGVKTGLDLYSIITDDAMDYYGNKKTLTQWAVKTGTGFQIETNYVDSNIRRKFVELKDNLDEHQAFYSKDRWIALSQAQGSTPESIAKKTERAVQSETQAYDVLNQSYKETQTEMAFYAQKARELGLSDKEIIEILAKANLKGQIVHSILTGKTQDMKRIPIKK